MRATSGAAVEEGPKIQPSVHQNHPWDRQQAMIAMIMSAKWQLQIRAAVTVFPAVALSSLS
jgi:hypothetical protein